MEEEEGRVVWNYMFREFFEDGFDLLPKLF